MKIFKILTISFALTGLLSACGGGEKSASTDESMNQSTTTSASDDGVVATVNGKPVLQKHFSAYVKQRKAGRPDAAEISDARMLDEYINFELALQDAETRQLENKPAIKEELSNQRRTILVNAAFMDYAEKNPLTDEEMRKDYEARMAEMTLTEYNLRHILLTNSDDATSVMTALNKGGDFIALVKQYSTGPSSKEGGLLGWQSEFDLLPEFRGPVGQLEKGQYARTPVKTRFGWHILYLEDKRVSPPPAYEEVKDRVRTVLQRRQVEKYFLQLRTTAEIKITEFEDSKPTIPQHQGVDIKTMQKDKVTTFPTN